MPTFKPFENIVEKEENAGNQHFLLFTTVFSAPSQVDFVGKNSFQLSGYGIGFWCTRSLVRILPGPYISAVQLLICFLVTDFVRKMEARPGLVRAINPI